MIDISKAIEMVGKQTGVLAAARAPLAESVGRVLREDIVADTDLPPFDRSQMDGFAVIASDTRTAPVSLKVVGESAAGNGWHKTMKPGEAVRIMTGAPLPPGADAVQKVELTRESSAAEGRVEVLEATETDRFIIQQASEIGKGTIIFKSGDVVTENMVAALASFGYAKLTVGKRPRVAILGTGSEIVEIAKKPGRDQIRNSNSVMLYVLSQKLSADPTIIPMVEDDISKLKTAIRSAARSADMLVITGGVSVGKYDHTKTVLAELGAEIFFDKVRLKPGKPAVFATLGKTMIFGLPGNPVSAAVTFHLFVRKAILKMQGAARTDLRHGHATLVGDARAAKERDTYLPARLDTNQKGMLVATPLRWLGSSDFIGFAQADSLIIVPKGKHLKAGEVAEIVFL